MGDNVGNRGPVRWVVRKHQRHQVHELRVEEALRVVLLVPGPELARLSVVEPLVKLVRLLCLEEGRVARVEREQNHPDGEQIHLSSPVLVSLVNLRRHVILGTHQALHNPRTLVAGNRLRKAQVDDLDGVVRVQEDISALKVSVCHALRVHEQDSVKDLRKDVADEVLLEASLVLDAVEELATRDQVLDDVRDLVALVWLDHGGLLAEAVKLDDVIVLEADR